MTLVKEFEGKLYTNYTTPGKNEFYSRLYEAWNAGQATADKWDERTTPYDYVVIGVMFMIRDVVQPAWWTKKCSVLDIERRFGPVVRRIPSNADAAFVYSELRRCYPDLMRGRGRF